jgi:hypothetical protein
MWRYFSIQIQIRNPFVHTFHKLCLDMLIYGHILRYDDVPEHQNAPPIRMSRRRQWADGNTRISNFRVIEGVCYVPRVGPNPHIHIFFSAFLNFTQRSPFEKFWDMSLRTYGCQDQLGTVGDFDGGKVEVSSNDYQPPMTCTRLSMTWVTDASCEVTFDNLG